MTVAQRLCDSGHYAAPSIRMQANKLDRDWQTFAAAVEERSTILALSVVFHKKANEVILFLTYRFLEYACNLMIHEADWIISRLPAGCNNIHPCVH